jgi:PIN domain nuclease of toxin-antitoxin system
MASVLIDTHVALWWQLEPKRLSSKAKKSIEYSDEVLISAISAWEIVHLERNGKIRLDRSVTSWIDSLVHLERVRTIPISASIAAEAALLPARGFHRDPADQFIYATALSESVALCTKDGLIDSYAHRVGDVRIIW